MEAEELLWEFHRIGVLRAEEVETWRAEEEENGLDCSTLDRRRVTIFLELFMIFSFIKFYLD